MIKTLLEETGEADKTTIAKKILEYDFSQVEYYENVTNVMVGKVLRNHDIVEKQKNLYSLKSYDQLSETDVQELIGLCNEKIDRYIENRGKKIWEHRRRNRRPVPGSIRYKVLKRAKGRCELCGISKDEKAIEVDHIVPKNQGGEDSINNYQVLCYSCNANKRDTDDTDFRNLNDQFSKRKKGCIFCDYPESRVILENNLAIAIKDKYPVTELHSLIIPKRHCDSYFDLSHAELNAINQLLKGLKSQLENKDDTIEGFNVGINNGEVSGQTISHCHVHLMPRREGDVDNPIGGVRNVIVGKGDYKI
ncbi:HIT domain-containing protein [Lutimonas saemankumensis]|uniref:HIT domain-containing protein n=1 Tax=Lutimonas saemankumensis TaxID=483016 RepID=UPI001CD346EC|nr:HIT domain-containing protein [Lutimonas saemankumensis]MCA0933106.1 HIT domain-containing protein [Lutimonas saemankumensis]